MLEPFTDLVSNWHIEYMCRIAEEEIFRINRKEKRKNHVLCNVPPRSLKSFVWSVCLPAWGWVVNPHLIFVNISHDKSLSLEHNGKTRDLIESEWYKTLFPEVVIRKGENKKSGFANTKGGSRFSTSVLAGMIGKGADVLIFDDALDTEKAHSDVKREATIRQFKEGFQTRLNKLDIGSILVIEQRLHEEDLSGYILNNLRDKYHHISLPATNEGEISPPELKKKYKKVDGEDKLYLFPERFGKSELETFKINLGSYGYAGQMLQAPAPPDGGILKKSWFRDLNHEAFFNATRGAKFHLFVDGAYTDKSYNDATAVMVACEVRGFVYVQKVFNFRLEEPEAIRKIQEIHDNYCTPRVSCVYIEPKASGIGFLQNLQRHANMRVIKDDTLRRLKGDKKARVFDITPDVESGRVILLNEPYKDEFINQCASFPNAKHDDMVDTLVMACKNLLRPSLMLG